MDNKQVQEMLFDTMQKVKKEFDRAAEEKNGYAMCSFSEALTKLAHEIVALQDAERTTKLLKEIAETLDKIKSERGENDKDVTDLLGLK